MLMMNLFKHINLNHYVQLVELEPVNNHLTHGSIKEHMCMFIVIMMFLLKTIMQLFSMIKTMDLARYLLMY
jgi:hypothetical protein